MLFAIGACFLLSGDRFLFGETLMSELVKLELDPVEKLENGFALVIGNTPLIRLRNLEKNLSPDVQLYAKAEWLNPGGSIKDRPALNIIRTALKNGDIGKGKQLLDSTSGNMGIAYAMIGASLSLPVTLTVPSNASRERFVILNSFGAKLVLTDPLEGSDGAILAAAKLYEEEPQKYFYAKQYDNPANWRAHFKTTGPEIWEQTKGRLTHFIAGLGTSGTMTGITRFLKEKDPNIECISFQPDSPFHGLEGLKHMGTAIKPGIYDQRLFDGNRQVSTEKAYQMIRRLALEEGLFLGISSGAAAVAAVELAEELDEGVIVTVFPDSGYKYISENFWEGGR